MGIPFPFAGLGWAYRDKLALVITDPAGIELKSNWNKARTLHSLPPQVQAIPANSLWLPKFEEGAPLLKPASFPALLFGFKCKVNGKAVNE